MHISNCLQLQANTPAYVIDVLVKFAGLILSGLKKSRTESCRIKISVTQSLDLSEETNFRLNTDGVRTAQCFLCPSVCQLILSTETGIYAIGFRHLSRKGIGYGLYFESAY